LWIELCQKCFSKVLDKIEKKLKIELKMCQNGENEHSNEKMEITKKNEKKTKKKRKKNEKTKKTKQKTKNERKVGK